MNELVAAARKRPGMYVGSTDARGVSHLFEYAVHLLFAYSAKRLTVALDGRRMRLETDAVLDAEKLLAALTDDSPRMMTVNEATDLVLVSALSSEFSIDIVSEAGWSSFRSTQGLRVEPAGTAPKQLGSRIEFEADASIFKSATFIASGVERRLRDLAALRPGLSVQFRHSNGELTIEVVTPRGLAQWLEYTGVSGVRAGAVSWGEARLWYAYGEAPGDESVRGFVNSVPVHKGSHIRGLRAALTDVAYAPVDHLNLHAVIQVELAHERLSFEGPTKQVLALPDLEAGIRAAVATAIRGS